MSGLLLWGPPTAWAAFLLWLGDQPAGSLPKPGFWIFPHADKVAHAAAYGALGFLLARALRLKSLRSALWVGGAAALLLGGLDEWNQRFSSGRSAETADLLADILGGAAGAAAFALLTRGVTRHS